MIPPSSATGSPARYLLRIDDLCPTVAAEPWGQIAALIQEFRLQPLLAIVPENRDPELAAGAADEGFWEQMRALESGGACVGLHGYRHVCATTGRGLVRLSHRSEFAGVPEFIQRAWIGEGLDILRARGLHPRLWVAPRHGFDLLTLRALQTEGIRILSDGFARRPYLRAGMTWIPQQLWAPVAKCSGLWTICIHPRSAEIETLRGFLSEHAAQFMSVDRALAEFPPRRLSVAERTRAQMDLWRVRLRRLCKR